MRSPMFGSAIWLALAATSVAQSQYGYNQLPVRQDSELIAVNFPDVDVELRAPAFLEPGSIPSGFANGTEPATSHKDMGKLHRLPCLLPVVRLQNTMDVDKQNDQSLSCSHWPTSTTG